MTPAQCKAARALLGWDQIKAAKAMGISRTTLSHFENGHQAIKSSTVALICTTLESEGIVFFYRICNEIGVKLISKNAEKL